MGAPLFPTRFCDEAMRVMFGRCARNCDGCELEVPVMFERLSCRVNFFIFAVRTAAWDAENVDPAPHVYPRSAARFLMAYLRGAG